MWQGSPYLLQCVLKLGKCFDRQTRRQQPEGSHQKTTNTEVEDTLPSSRSCLTSCPSQAYGTNRKQVSKKVS